MTDSSSHQPGSALLRVPPSVAADIETEVRSLTKGLVIALEATRLAVENSNDAPSRILGQSEASEILERWQVNNLVLNEVFDNLYFQTRLVVGRVKVMAGIQD